MTKQEPAQTAPIGWKRYTVTHVAGELDMLIEPGTDLDGEFKAWCLDTGCYLTVKGWLAEINEYEGDDPDFSDLPTAGDCAMNRDDAAAAACDDLARAMMAVRPDLKAMSLDEWLAEHWHSLTMQERAAANAIIDLCNER